VYPHFQGIVGVGRRSWALSHADLLTKYIRAYVQAMDWLSDLSHRDEAVSLLRRHLPQMSENVATESYRRMVEDKGFSPRAQFDADGARQVLALRSHYAEPPRELKDPMKYYDATYYKKAIP
jgi:ABC-type nitrate/sulfonate/bicarbonate transport system substrate-binding protein